MGQQEASGTGLSRRGLLGLAGAGGLAVGGAVGAGWAGTRPPSAADPYPFFGEHQSGIATPVQDHLHFAAFDLAADAGRAELVGLLQDWSYAASRMTQGLPVSAAGAVGGDPQAPPGDTGEALGLPHSGLTITIGLGPRVFGRADGSDPFGLAHLRPAQLDRMPPFLGDALRARISHGDLCVQACADDPQVAVHAVRNLTRIAFGRAAVRWSQIGFGRTSKTTADQETPRNLFGFKDGTDNILAGEREVLEENVWVQPEDDPAWLRGGSYLVVRKIQMLIETWDRVRLAEQETIIGRTKGTGAPLSGGEEYTAVDFAATGADGSPAIDVAAHVRLAHPHSTGGVRLLRRGYNYTDGSTELGGLDAGLFFLAYQRSPADFITVQRNLATDLMNEYVRHIGSAVFAIPPGAPEGGWVGEQLFD